MSLKRDKSVEFSSDILTHLLLVLFINIFHRGIVIWFFLSAKAFKGRYFCREGIFFQQNYHPIDPSRATP